MKIISLIALPLLSLSLVSCMDDTAVFDELAGETPDDETLDGKADARVDGSYTYFAISADFRKCAYPMCGGFFLDRLNRSTTKCHDGKERAACYAPELDLSESGLSARAHDKLVAAAGASLEPGVRALVRGRFAKSNSTPMPELGRFIVTEVWLAQSDSVPSGVFVRLKDNGLRCIAAPCPSTTERGLNTSRSATISDLDFTASAIDDEAVAELVHEMFLPHGLIIAGSRFEVSVDGRKGKGRTATAVYRRLFDEAEAPCFVGGCSGQICSDQEGVISTCEFRPEYACYADATCERQVDGECGWTPTPELEACLGQSAP
jgi:hypothetical protein